MPKPILIDTDMGVDDAVAITLALCAPELTLVGMTSVGGNVPLEQATRNMGRLLTALELERWPALARGLDQEGDGLEHALHVHGPDGMGGLDLPDAEAVEIGDFRELYERLIIEHGDALTIIAIGPLTNLAALRRDRPDLLARVGQIIVMGGAIWCPGNVTPHAEFNFYRDPQAAADVLGDGLPVTVVPLDVTRQVAMDESHIAHLSRSGTRAGDLLARMIRFPMEQASEESAPGQFLVHDALTVGGMLWPQLFMRSRMGLSVTIDGEQAGRCRPLVARDKSRQLSVIISVQVGEFVENLMETLCHETFIV
jgi:inosine-uridine nucleoside N-ribohydrolase